MTLLTQTQKDYIINNVETLATTVKLQEKELHDMRLKYELLHKDFISLKKGSVVTVIDDTTDGYDSCGFALEDFYAD